MVASLYSHYRISIRAAKSSVTMELTGGDAAREYKGVIKQIGQQISPLDEASLERPFESQPVQRNLDAYFTRVTATNESKFVSDFFTAFILMIVLVTLGGQIMRQGEGWTALLTYLLAMRYGMNQIKSALSGFAGINRFFHQMRAYFLFVNSQHEPLRPATAVTTPESLTISCEARSALPGSRQQLVIRPGERIVLYGPFQPTRFQMHALFAQLFGESMEMLRAIMARTRIVADEEVIRLVANRGAADGERDERRDETNGNGLSFVVVSARSLRSHDTSETTHSGRSEISAAALHLQGNEAALALVDRLQLLRLFSQAPIVVSDGESVRWIGETQQLHLIESELEEFERENGIRGTGGSGGYDDDDDDDML
jgi:hypothetical protein